MIRERMASRDDRRLVQLIVRELVPYARMARPDTKWTRKELLERLDANTVLVAVSRRLEPPRGFLAYHIRDRSLHLDMLAVGREQQGRGYGSALIEAAERAGVAAGCVDAKLFVDEPNGRARRFYARRGYREERYVKEMKCLLLTRRFYL
ncbi:hypothetical protein J31TS4_41490 [Paenibacillus sp. J31TS4]|uniref:GNAT family N-acetyltransferase n=1 Tax=Paenibacillus sp. J31TS4 TaxID=2807195 RepID=UPI001B2C463E|nr:GNAT family N-acetyltransferase [Paenibacillus sp. J31TS4]GIP40869.1 hypothetical protein J31TS4_41490 [Paenibacillus sp. J31TS4]